MPTVLITGANRGLGLGFAKVFSEDGWQVIAAVRDPAGAEELRALNPSIDIRQMDLSNFESVDALAEELKGTAIDVLLGNAAKTNNPMTDFGETDYDTWAEAFRVNAMGQMKLAEAFVEHVAASEMKIMYFVSSRVGAEPLAGLIPFRSSKSALNQVTYQLSLLLKDRGIKVACGHPGFVKSKSTAGMGVFEAEESAGYLKKIIEGLTLETSGRFYEPDGSTLPIVTQQTNPAAFGAKPPDAWDDQKEVWDKDGK